MKTVDITLTQTNPISLGLGERSEAQAYRLHQNLERSLEILSGMQQGAEVSEDQRDSVIITASQIFEALTGYRVAIRDRQKLT